jgi:predicted phosphodiesterase
VAIGEGCHPEKVLAIDAADSFTKIELLASDMRIFALSDIHVDFEANARWISSLSAQDHREDFLILAGDVSHSLQLLTKNLELLANRFRKVFYVPGNHDLWVIRDSDGKTSFDKFNEIAAVMENCGVSGAPFHDDTISIVPLLGWYDYSFGEPSNELTTTWVDFLFCKWPDHLGMEEIASRFAAMNEPLIRPPNNLAISFSHFVPRIDVMPDFISERNRIVYPVLGSILLERQIRQIRSDIHVYGHTHVNRRVDIDGTAYINNAFGYPSETRIAAKRLLCIHES